MVRRLSHSDGASIVLHTGIVCVPSYVADWSEAINYPKHWQFG